MYFGTTAFKTEPNIVTESYGIESVVYTEYLNKKSILESCTDEAQRPLLEAQLQVLQEVAIKDIWNKVKEAFIKLKNWIKNLWDSIFNKAKKRRAELKEYADKDFENFKKNMNDSMDKAFGHDDVSEKYKEYLQNFVNSLKMFRYRCDNEKHDVGDIRFWVDMCQTKADHCADMAKSIHLYSSENMHDIVDNNIKEIKELTDSINTLEIEEYPASEDIRISNFSPNKDRVVADVMSRYQTLQKAVDKDYNAILNSKKEIDKVISDIEKELERKQKLVDDLVEKVGDEYSKTVAKFQQALIPIKSATEQIKLLNVSLFKISEKVNSIAGKIMVETAKVEAFMQKDFEYTEEEE